MTDILQPKFEQPKFEKDIEQLSAQVKESREQSLKNKISPRDMLKSAIGEKIQQIQPAAPQKKTDLPAYLENESPEMKTKIQELVDIALVHGVEKSVAEAKRYSPFVLDALHDALTEKIYTELKNRGKLK